jgi:hypothetical protein
MNSSYEILLRETSFPFTSLNIPTCLRKMFHINDTERNNVFYVLYFICGMPPNGPPPISALYGERRRDSVVGIATGRPRRRSSSPGRVKSFLFSKSSRPALRSTQPPIQWVAGALSPGVKRPGSEADHSPPTSQENVDLYIHSPIRPHGVVLN